jgi:ribosomal-protein-alanine N-acetyltransferase
MPELSEYRASDFEHLWELDQRCFPAGIAYSREEFAYYLRDKTAVCLIAREREQILGFILAHRDRRGFGHIVTLDVNPAAHRSGIGSALMQAAEERLLRAGCQSIFLEVAVNNLPAVAFYKKHGYSVIKSLRRYYPGGLDGLLMRKQVAG